MYEASKASGENGIRILLAALISFPGGNKINNSQKWKKNWAEACNSWEL